jgi:hypothetical protein
MNALAVQPRAEAQTSARPAVRGESPTIAASRAAATTVAPHGGSLARCACGGAVIAGGECAPCRRERVARQPSALSDALAAANLARAAGGPRDHPQFIGDLEDYPTFDAEWDEYSPFDDGGSDAIPTAGPSGGGCSSICDRAYASASLNGGGGGVICDGAQKCACVFDVAPLKRGSCPGFDAIVLTHERRHLGDVDCNASAGLHRPPFRDPAQANASECTHRRESIREMDAVIPVAAGSCKRGMQQIRGVLAAWVAANCSSP